jgi:hypothetical protein
MSALVLVHVIISLIAIVAGLVVMFGMLSSNRMPGLTALFLATTILTSATGFIIPPFLTAKLLPSHAFGILSLILLAIACFALYSQNLSGKWRWIYVLTALISLYLNAFVLVIQSFLKIPALSAIAPGIPPAGPVFGVVQLVVLAFFAFMTFRAVKRFHPA